MGGAEMKRRLVAAVARFLVGVPVIRVQVLGYALWDRVQPYESGPVIYVREWPR